MCAQYERRGNLNDHTTSHGVVPDGPLCNRHGSARFATSGCIGHEILSLCDKIRQTAFDLHAYLKHGHLEKAYEKGLAHRLRKAGIVVVPQHPLQVHDIDGELLGDYLADSAGPQDTTAAARHLFSSCERCRAAMYASNSAKSLNNDTPGSALMISKTSLICGCRLAKAT